jgi:hypothetical protein
VDKRIILHLGAQRAKHGADGLVAIRAALDRMTEADRAREMSSRLIRHGSRRHDGGRRAPTVSDPTDAMAAKEAVDDAADGGDGSLRLPPCHPQTTAATSSARGGRSVAFPIWRAKAFVCEKLRIPMDR